MDYIQFIVKMLIGFGVIIIMFRIFGKKELSQMNPLDMLYVVVIADFFSGSVTDTAIDWKKLLFILISWGVLIYILESITRHKKAQKLIDGSPQVLIKNGVINKELQDKEKITRDEIDMMLRQTGVFDIELVELGILEIDGQISVKKKQES